MKIFALLIATLLASAASADNTTFVGFNQTDSNDFVLAYNGTPCYILVDSNDFKGVKLAAHNLQKDLQQVTGNKTNHNTQQCIIAGTIGKSNIINQLVKQGKLDSSQLKGKYEKYVITVVEHPTTDVKQALVIAGSDMRGTVYGIYELSKQIGVSPWYYWADVPIPTHQNIFVRQGVYTDGEPAVKYRGIFINDEAPAFQGWADETFGGVNSQLYQHVFELILRLKGNFLWPAMWGNAFYDDDPNNGILANDMGIVIGTSHHEPLGRAHDEWKRYGKGSWNYKQNKYNLQEFWKTGLKRIKNYETVLTVGMRGDGDEPMTQEANVKLLQRIVKEQRKIIKEVTGKKPELTPQVWALYKEVQDYYDKGMKVPDDVTLLLSDDNWGNVRKLPDINAPKRQGGYGMYYHLDYVGGPRNYKWLNVTQIQRVWEQMNLTYSHGVDKIWIVNVGDIKPMEYPIQFFLDMAWNPNQFNPDNLLSHTELWCKQQFGSEYAQETARLINTYTKFNSRVTPELLDENTFSLDNYNEFEIVVNDYKELALDAHRLYNLIPNTHKDAFDQLALFPINAMCNLYEMYLALALNKKFAQLKNPKANLYADKVIQCFKRDSILTQHYHNINNGKWNHMMDQVRIGYTYWQQPNKNICPKVQYVNTKIPDKKRFVEQAGNITIDAVHFAYSRSTNNSQWTIVPHLGKTNSSITTLPPNVYPQQNDTVAVDYLLYTTSTGKANVTLYLAPTLNFNNNKGLKYTLSVDNGQETINNFNGHYKGQLGQWQGERIIKTTDSIDFGNRGKHTLTIRALDPGIVVQKITVDFKESKQSYLGPTESNFIATENEE